MVLRVTVEIIFVFNFCLPCNVALFFLLLQYLELLVILLLLKVAVQVIWILLKYSLLGVVLIIQMETLITMKLKWSNTTVKEMKLLVFNVLMVIQFFLNYSLWHLYVSVIMCLIKREKLRSYTSWNWYRIHLLNAWLTKFLHSHALYGLFILKAKLIEKGITLLFWNTYSTRHACTNCCCLFTNLTRIPFFNVFLFKTYPFMKGCMYKQNGLAVIALICIYLCMLLVHMQSTLYVLSHTLFW